MSGIKHQILNPDAGGWWPGTGKRYPVLGAAAGAAPGERHPVGAAAERPPRRSGAGHQQRLRCQVGPFVNLPERLQQCCHVIPENP